MGTENHQESQKEGLAWSVIRVNPGYERTIKEKMVERLQTLPVHHPGMQILIPADGLVEPDDKKRYLGYILVKMQTQKDVWAVLMNTPGVTGFIGISTQPTLFTQKDWMDIPFHQFPKLK